MDSNRARPHRLRRVLGLSLLLALPAAGPVAALPATTDEGDEQYRFLAGLIEKGLFELAVEEGTSFLRDHADHDKAELARYRLATALFELDRHAEASPHFGALADARGFEYRAECAFRLGQCELTRERYDRAQRAFEAVLQLGQDYLKGSATFFLGETAFRRGDHAAAQTAYRRVVRSHPGSDYVPAARRGLVWCAWEEHEVDATVERARTFLSNHADAENADEIRVLLGEALLEKGAPDEALAAFGSVRTPAFGDAMRRGAGFAYAARGDHARAAQEFGRLVAEHPESRFADEARLQVGIQTLRSGDAPGAARALREPAGSGQPEALYWLAQAQSEDGKHQAALRSLERALERDPDDALRGRIQVARGDVLNALGRTEAALEAYESGGSEYALYAAAVAALNDDEPGKAVQLIGRLFERHPESSYGLQALLVRGEAHFAREELERAARDFRAVLAGDADPALDAQALNRLGWCRYLAGDLDGASRRYGELAERYADEEAAEEGLYMLGRVLREAGDDQGARQANARYLRRHPDGPHAAEVMLAAARATEGDAGVRALETLLERQGESELVPVALLELADRLSADGRLEEAEARYARLLTEHPRAEVAPEARYGLGWCLYERGEHRDAARLLQEVGSDRSAAAELRTAAWELCVWALTRAGEPGLATEAWRRFAKATDDDQRRFASAQTVAASWRDAGRPGEGQRVLEELLRQLDDPAVAVEVLLEGAYLALEEDDVDRADAQVQVAARRSQGAPAVAEASFFVGEARFAAGEDARAIALYRAAAAEESPVRASALYKLGFALMRTGALEEAAAAFATVVEEHPGHELWGESLFLAGEALYREGRLEEAARLFERLRREAPEHQILPKALFRQGLAHGRLEHWQACEDALTRLARAAPEFPNLTEAELWRGRALAAQRKTRAARQAFERVVAGDKGELAAQARLGLGRLLEREGRTDEALSEFLKVALLYAHEEEVSEALYRAGTCLEAQGDREKALEQYRVVVDQHPRTRFADTARKALERLQG
jgi:TolA-binding protein